MRFTRCSPNPRSPRACHIIAVKNPLNAKNTGIRKPWIPATM